MSLVGQENRQENISETRCILRNIINNFFNEEHSYYKSISSQELPIIANIVRKGWHRNWVENDHD